MWYLKQNYTKLPTLFGAGSEWKTYFHLLPKAKRVIMFLLISVCLSVRKIFAIYETLNKFSGNLQTVHQYLYIYNWLTFTASAIQDGHQNQPTLKSTNRTKTQSILQKVTWTLVLQTVLLTHLFWVKKKNYTRFFVKIQPLIIQSLSVNQVSHDWMKWAIYRYL